jgi:hypothetical protein
LDDDRLGQDRDIESGTSFFKLPRINKHCSALIKNLVNPQSRAMTQAALSRFIVKTGFLGDDKRRPYVDERLMSWVRWLLWGNATPNGRTKRRVQGQANCSFLVL